MFGHLLQAELDQSWGGGNDDITHTVQGELHHNETNPGSFPNRIEVDHPKEEMIVQNKAHSARLQT